MHYAFFLHFPSPPPLSTDLTVSLKDVWYADEFIISLSNIKGNKIMSGSSFEPLLSVNYAESKTKMILILDPWTKRGESNGPAFSAGSAADCDDCALRLYLIN